MRFFTHVAMLFVFIFSLFTCKKEKTNPCDASITANLPAVTIDSVYRDGDKIVITGNVLQVGQDDTGLSAHGVVWSQNLTPSLQNGQSKDLGAASASGRFTVTLDSLAPGDYQFRTFATNCASTQYSSAVKNLMVTVQGKPFVQVNDAYLISATGNDGIINPGDDVQYGFTVQNVGTLKANAVTATLYTASTQFIGSLSPALFNIGALNPGGAISGPQTLSFKMGVNTPPGLYCLSLDIDADGEKRTDTICFQVVQTVVADFIADKDTCFAPCIITFDASSSVGQNLTYTWDFGNGATSSGKTTSYTFTKAGTFNVKLTVNGDGGSSEKSIPVTIKSFTILTDIPIPNSNHGAWGFGQIAIDVSSGEYNYFIPTGRCFGLDGCDLLITRLDNNGFVQESPSYPNGSWVSSVKLTSNQEFLFASSGQAPFLGIFKTDLLGNPIFGKGITDFGSGYRGLFVDEKFNQNGHLALAENNSYPDWLYVYNLDIQGNEVSPYDSINISSQVTDKVSILTASFFKIPSLKQYVFVIEGYDGNNADNYLIIERRNENLGLIVSKSFTNTIWNPKPSLLGNKIIIFGDYCPNKNCQSSNLRFFQIDLNGAIISDIEDRTDLVKPIWNDIGSALTSDGNICMSTSVLTGNDEDIYLAKYSVSSNKFIWEKTFPSPLFQESVKVIAESPDGGFVISGKRGNNLLFLKTTPDGDVE